MPDLKLRTDIKISRITSKSMDMDKITSKMQGEMEDKERIQPNTGKKKSLRKTESTT